MPFLINSELLHLCYWYFKYPLKGKDFNKRSGTMAVLEGCPPPFFLLQPCEISVKVGSVCLPQAFFLFLLVTEHSTDHFHIRLVQLLCFHDHKGQESLLCTYSLFYYNSFFNYYNSESAWSDYTWAHLPWKRFGITLIPSPTTLLL